MKYDFDARSKAAQLSFENTVSLTKQEFVKTCDINNILSKYKRNGVNPFVMPNASNYLDLSTLPSYHEALNLINDADEQFMLLPAKIRAQFLNDPGALLAFLADPKNEAQAIELGLVEPKVTPQGETSSIASNSLQKDILNNISGENK